MSVMVAEKVYDYPWRRRIGLVTLGNLLVLLSVFSALYQLARGLLAANEGLIVWLRRTSWLRPLLDALSPLPQDLNLWMSEALGVLLWALVGLLIALVLLNAFPAVRVSSRGLLVAFSGSWLPVAWEDLQHIHVTGDASGQRFILLVIPAKRAKRLTGWHRLYGLLYGTTLRPAFFISSDIDGFDQLLNTILQENARVVRGIEGGQPLVVDEQRRSPLLGLLLRGESTSEAAPVAVNLPPTNQPDVVATLPRFSLVQTVTFGSAAVILLLALFHYRSYWDRALSLLFPAYRSNPAALWVSRDPVYKAIFESYQGVGVSLFGIAGRADLPAPFWLIIAAHIMLALAVIAGIAIVAAVPVVAVAGQQSLLIRYSRRLQGRRFSIVIPWTQIQACKVIDLGFGKQIAFVQSSRLPWFCRLCGLIVSGRWQPGVVLVGTMTNWADLIVRCAERLNHLPPIKETPRFQPAAFAPNLQLIGQPVATIKAMAVELAAGERSISSLLWAAARSMLLVSLPVGLMFSLPALIDGDRWPNMGMILGGLAFWLAGLLEWPLIVLISFLIHGNFTNEEDQARIFAFYPLVQMPRLLPMLLALVCLLINLPWLAALFWFGALAIAYWVTAALWVEVYEWDGSQAILGGLLPVIWNILVMLGFWLLR
ncbi:hypothetical protein [Chloroflexus aurantiacus]|jgi:hypothetical protein|nr:MAG: hypothetical protein KatS3mg056_2037 [Chloroflexus sp.]